MYYEPVNITCKSGLDLSLNNFKKILLLLEHRQLGGFSNLNNKSRAKGPIEIEHM
jgi:hypothetical protein